MKDGTPNMAYRTSRDSAESRLVTFNYIFPEDISLNEAFEVTLELPLKIAISPLVPVPVTVPVLVVYPAPFVN